MRVRSQRALCPCLYRPVDGYQVPVLIVIAVVDVVSLRTGTRTLYPGLIVD
jgi:hypothetical protein